MSSDQSETSQTELNSDVAVIGASLAGLAAARTLRAAGYRCTVFDSADRVGGRVASDMVDDITVDTGFQTFNSWYPSLKELLRPGEYAALGLKSFQPGVQVLAESGEHSIVVDPVRAPRLLPAFLRSVKRSPWSLEDVRGLNRWLATEISHRSSLEMRRIKESQRMKDRSVGHSLDESGLTGTLRRQVLEPIVRAFTLDPQGRSSELYAKWLLITLLRGTLAVPENGMGEISETLARIPGVRIELNSKVTGVTITESGRNAGVTLHLGERGETQHFRYAISAVPTKVESELFGTDTVPTVGMSSWWFVSDEPAESAHQTVLTLDGSGRTPISSAATLTAVAPAYAPNRHLIAASVVHDGSPLPSDAEMLGHLGQLYTCDLSGWELVARQDLPDVNTIALPRHRIPLEGQIPTIDGRVYLAGTHHATPSMDGALRSGQRAAKNLIQDMQGS